MLRLAARDSRGEVYQDYGTRLAMRHFPALSVPSSKWRQMTYMMTGCRVTVRPPVLRVKELHFAGAVIAHSNKVSLQPASGHLATVSTPFSHGTEL